LAFIGIDSLLGARILTPVHVKHTVLYHTIPFCIAALMMNRWVRNMVKCAVVQAVRLCTGCTVRRGSKGIAVLYRH
jgi:hypothetical protein